MATTDDDVIGALPAPPNRILVVGDDIYASAVDRASFDNPREGEPGNGGVFRFRAGELERIAAWPRARLAAVDEDFVWYWYGSFRRTPLHGGDEYRVAMNVWDIAFDDELAYLVAQGCVFTIPGRGPLTGEAGEAIVVLSADVAQVEVDDAYIVTIENEPDDRLGFRIVKRPKRGGAPVELARESRSARTFALRDGIAFVALQGGPVLEISVDGDTRREVSGTEGVEHVAIDGPFLYWASSDATSRHVLHRRSLYDPGAPIERVCELSAGSSRRSCSTSRTAWSRGESRCRRRIATNDIASMRDVSSSPTGRNATSLAGMAIDRGDSHFDDAGSWEKACRHMALFLWWAAERGLASEDHDVESLRKDATKHFIEQCDTKLWDEDLTDEGNAFAEKEYDAYLGEVHAYASKLGVGDYEIPEGEATNSHFFAWLDGRRRVS